MKRRYAWLLVAAVAAVSVTASGSSAQPPPVRGIWISPLGLTTIIPGLTRSIRAVGLDTVVVPVFYDGRVIYPSRIFPQHDRHLGIDPAAAFVAEAHRRGLRVLAAMDLLYWQSSGVLSPAVQNHPQWRERTAEGRVVGDVAGKPGAFVSPCEERVKSLLAELASEMASRYDFDGLVLDYARWSRLDSLGYADADRKLYLQERGADPLDIDLLGYATPQDMIQGLVRWQEQQITAVTEAVARAFRREKPNAMVLVVVEPAYYGSRITNPVRQDWRSWLRQDWLSAVMPDGIAYGNPRDVRSQLRAATGTEGAPVVALIRRSDALPARPQMQVVSSLELQGFILCGRDSLRQRREIMIELRAR